MSSVILVVRDLDNEGDERECSIEDFMAANADDEHACAVAACLAVGESAHVGLGYEIERVR